MIQHMFILFCLLFALKSVESDVITVQEGEDAKIKCDHVFAHGNVKYFCRDPCTEPQHVLIKSDQPSLSHPKYILADNGYGVFTVTISKVNSTDSGIYYCGVDRFVKDTFTEVTVKVIADHATTHSILPSSLSPSAAKSLWHDITDSRYEYYDYEEYDYNDDYSLHAKRHPGLGDTSMQNNNHQFIALHPGNTLRAAPMQPRRPVEKEEGRADMETKPQSRSKNTPEETERQQSDTALVAEYICAGLSVLILVLVLIFFILYTRKIRKVSGLSAGRNLSTSSGNVQQSLDTECTASPSAQVECNYAEVTISHGNPNLVAASSLTTHSTESSAIYSNVLSNQNPESVYYSPKPFNKDEESLQYVTVRLNDPPAGGDKQESTPDSVIYSTIKI